MPITPLDLTAERFEIGDTDEVVTKQNSTAAKFEQLAREVIEDNAALRSESAALRSDSETLFNQVRSENASVVGELRNENEASLSVNLTDTLSSQLNLAPDHGTFIRQSNHPSDVNGFALDAELAHESLSDIVETFNGCAIGAPVEVGRHRYNSTTHGGSRNASDAIALNFLAAMNKDNPSDIRGRFLPEFAVVEYTAGLTGSGSNYDDCYGWHHTNRLSHISSAHGEASFSYYFQAIDADAWVFGNAKTSLLKMYVDGVEILNTGNTDGEWLKLNKGQVYHIAGSISMVDNQFIFSGIARTHVKLGTKFRVALPWAASGAFQMMPHSRPVRSYGTVGQSPLVDRRIRGGVDEVLTDVQNQAAAVLTAAQNDVAQVIQSAENQVDASAAELDSAADALLAYQNQQLNLYPNNGAFLGAGLRGRHDGSVQSFEPLDISTYMRSFNGSTLATPVGVGRFYQGRSNLDDGHDLLGKVFAEAMGIPYYSFHYSGFCVAQYTHGTGVSGESYQGCHHGFYGWHIAWLGHLSNVSMSLWYQAVSSDGYLIGSNSNDSYSVYVDGVHKPHNSGEGGTNYHKLIRGRIYHVAVSLAGGEPISIHPLGILGLPNTIHRIACPRVATGSFQLLPHKGAVRSSV